MVKPSPGPGGSNGSLSSVPGVAVHCPGTSKAPDDKKKRTACFCSLNKHSKYW